MAGGWQFLVRKGSQEVALGIHSSPKIQGVHRGRELTSSSHGSGIFWVPVSAVYGLLDFGIGQNFQAHILIGTKTEKEGLGRGVSLSLMSRIPPCLGIPPALKG